MHNKVITRQLDKKNRYIIAQWIKQPNNCQIALSSISNNNCCPNTRSVYNYFFFNIIKRQNLITSSPLQHVRDNNNYTVNEAKFCLISYDFYCLSWTKYHVNEKVKIGTQFWKFQKKLIHSTAIMQVEMHIYTRLTRLMQGAQRATQKASL